jgi:tRNA threonylcarbamoyl adenosine modification protein YjeE
MATNAEAGTSLLLPDERATEGLAQDVAAVLKPGDLVALSGGVGVGKTTFARALIRAIAADPLLEVQSPSFPLRIDHALSRMHVAHVDLYRIENASELDELGLDEAVGDGALIVEWPEQFLNGLSAERLDIRLEIAGAGRRAELVGTATWPARLERTGTIRAFLNNAGWENARRTPLAGDASYRAYESIEEPSPPLRGRDAEGRRTLPQHPPGPTHQGDRGGAVLMNAPARTEGPPIYSGRSYDAVAHRAMDVRAFIAVDVALRHAGIRAPEIFAADNEKGILLLEDLGGDGIADSSGRPIMERYEASIDLLAYMHGRNWPRAAPLPDGSLYRVPPYDPDALLIEISLFPDYFGGHGGEPAFPKERREEFLADWSKLLDTIDPADTTWTLRDFHSPNILWQPRASGLARVGVIDFQDTVLGHPAYDVASLAQDARVTLTAEQETSLKGRYLAARKADQPSFDDNAFLRAYSILGLQRATKVLGIFTRLALSEGKPGYQRHRTRLKGLIRRNLADPVLSPLRLWYEPYL